MQGLTILSLLLLGAVIDAIYGNPKTHINKDPVDEICKRNLNIEHSSEQQFKCYVECSMKESGALVNGVVDFAKLKDTMENPAVSDSMIKEAHEKCWKPAGENEDKCEHVYTYSGCLAEVILSKIFENNNSTV